ncbi:hypothetical protein BVC80_9097g180 [Macleaya cordata]|uniref:Glycine-rich protein n=1 Tax=Macleaya cordata TaxID=56857 RepID=A0A200QF04_MACCD|nr:hypothetical protein BVC80_9097g180 [Macleaya cordata]
MAGSEVTDGPVLSLMNKRLRALKKKYNRILQMEESISQGKTLNKEQEEVLRSKPGVVALIDEYEKLRQPLSTALQEELNLSHQVSAAIPTVNKEDEKEKVEALETAEHHSNSVVEDLLNLLYFGSLFDVKPQTDFTSMMLTKTHERGCCLTYDYVTDDATDLLGEKDLDMISMLGGLLIARPVHSGLSHKNALQSCIERAKLWLSKSDQPIEPGANITYVGLRERLNKILGSDYLTTTPEMKAPVEVAAAAGKYTVPVQHSSAPSEVPVQTEAVFVNDHQKDEENAFQEQGTVGDQSSPAEELTKNESELPNPVDVTCAQQDENKQEAVVEQNQRDMESKEQQYIPRRNYQNQRGGGRGSGGGGGRRGSNGRGGRNSRGGGGYQNGRSQYYDQPGNYYPRNYDNTRGRGGRGAGGRGYSNHGSADHGVYAPTGIEMGT